MLLRNIANHTLFLALALGSACSDTGLDADRHDQDLDPAGDEADPTGDDPAGDDALCAAVTCEVGSRCEVVQPQCFTTPCDPIAVCVPGDEPPTSPCDAVRCAEGTHCEEVEVQCFTTPCDPVAECVDDEPDCPPEPPSCALVDCAPGYVCEMVEVQCITYPCPPQPECVPVVDDPTSCAATLCMEGTYCDDISGHAECIPLPSCDDVRCDDGTHCELVEVQCIRAPCPPQPSCIEN